MVEEETPDIQTSSTSETQFMNAHMTNGDTGAKATLSLAELSPQAVLADHLGRTVSCVEMRRGESSSNSLCQLQRRSQAASVDQELSMRDGMSLHLDRVEQPHYQLPVFDGACSPCNGVMLDKPSPPYGTTTQIRCKH